MGFKKKHSKFQITKIQPFFGTLEQKLHKYLPIKAVGISINVLVMRLSI